MDSLYQYLFRRARSDGTAATPQRFVQGGVGDLVISANPLAGASQIDPETIAALTAENWRIRLGAVTELAQLMREAEAAGARAARLVLQQHMRDAKQPELNYRVRDAIAEALAERERRRAEAARKAEEEQRQAEAARKAEEEQRQAEVARKADEERRRADAARKAEEEQRRADAARRAEEEQRRAEAARKADEERRAQGVRLGYTLPRSASRPIDETRPRTDAWQLVRKINERAKAPPAASGGVRLGYTLPTGISSRAESPRTKSTRQLDLEQRRSETGLVKNAQERAGGAEVVGNRGVRLGYGLAPGSDSPPSLRYVLTVIVSVVLGIAALALGFPTVFRL